MKLLNNGVYVFRITYFNPYPPDIGDFTFHILGNTIESCIQDLCVSKRIKPDFVKERCTICKLETISDAFLDRLIGENLSSFLQRSEAGRKLTEDFYNKNKTKPMNTSVANDSMIFSPL